MGHLCQGLVAVTCLAIAGCSSGGSYSTTPGGGGGGGTASPAVIAMEDASHVLINAERQAQALPDLYHDATLRNVARLHSEDMVNRSFFSHTNPDGLDPFDRFALANVTYTTAGENIAWNGGFSDPAATAVTGWMNSAGHRANILNTQFTHAGLGAAQRSSDGAWYFTQVFTLPTGSLIMTGGWETEESTAGLDQGESSWVFER